MKTPRAVCVAVIPSKIPDDITGLAGRRLDHLFETAIAPAASACNMELIRLDLAVAFPLVERRIFDNLLLSDAAVFDIGNRVPEVLYLLGIRLALRPESTVLVEHVSAENAHYPAHPEALPYRFNDQGHIDPKPLGEFIEDLARRIMTTSREAGAIQTEYYHLLRDYRTVDISRTKTDRFRTAVQYRLDFKTRLSQARSLEKRDALLALRMIETEILPSDTVDSAVLVDLFLSYRAEGAWEDICRVYQILPLPLKRAVMIREQYALALNRQRMRAAALAVLVDIETAQGASSETSSLVGRIYKDLWQDRESEGDQLGAEQFLGASINAYRRGFKADWRDAYPGINLVTLLDVEGKAQSLSERDKLLPIVSFAAEQRVETGTSDYWDFATLLELAVLGDNRQEADRHLRNARERVTETWQTETTANNLRLLQRYRQRRQQDVGWMGSLVSRLLKKK
jgi:hypothetical protein